MLSISYLIQILNKNFSLALIFLFHFASFCFDIFSNVFVNSIYSSWNLAYLRRGWNLIGQINHFHLKITVSVTKSLHQDCGPCYLHLPVFSYTYRFLFYCQIKGCYDHCVAIITVFLSKLDDKTLSNYIYITKLF